MKWKNISLIDKKSANYILSNLTGDVHSGDFLTIMGPSGAGKSSFLSIITSKLSAYTGSFKVKGKVLNKNKILDNNQQSMLFIIIIYLNRIICSSR